MENYINWINEMRLESIDVDSNIAQNNYDYDEFNTDNLSARVAGVKLA